MDTSTAKPQTQPAAVLAVPKVPALENTDPIREEMSEVELLTHELKRILVGHEATLEQEGIREQVETLERWLESYRHGLSAAHKISEKGTGWLTDLRDKLKLSAEELQRLESEGGNPADKEQSKQAEELLTACQHIDEVMPSIQHMFSNKPEKETEEAI